MPDKRRHRGPAPEDHLLFSPPTVPNLRRAVSELSWLLSRGYADTSSLKIVGDRYSLRQRQRMAVMRCASTDGAMKRRCERACPVDLLGNRSLDLDGYNILTTIEVALSGGLVLVGRDGCLRDIASMHGSFRKVQETTPALELIGASLAILQVASCTWYLDKPVSNSGRLKTLILEIAATHEWPWQVHLVTSPDQDLMCSSSVVVTADSVILDRCECWANVADYVVKKFVKDAWILNLSGGDSTMSDGCIKSQ